MRREWGGYQHSIVGSPAIFDNTAEAYPDFSSDTLFIGDGNHRQKLAEEDGKLGEEFLADLYRGLTRPEMHRRRRGLNDRRTVRPVEEFLHHAEEGARDEQRIKDTVEGLGWTITYLLGTGHLRCTNELKWIWKRDHGALVQALQTYEHVWGKKTEQAQSRVLKGLGAFWIKYPQADADRLVRSMKGQTVDGLYRSGRNQNDENYFIKSVYDGIRYVIVLGYNKTSRKDQLPV